jgi:hypothetical protein
MWCVRHGLDACIRRLAEAIHGALKEELRGLDLGGETIL